MKVIKEHKPIKIICHACAEDLKTPFNKGAIGIREGVCDVCGDTKAVCSALHDYGIKEDGTLLTESEFLKENSI